MDKLVPAIAVLIIALAWAWALLWPHATDGFLAWLGIAGRSFSALTITFVVALVRVILSFGFGV